jgi:hypothetical protein
MPRRTSLHMSKLVMSNFKNLRWPSPIKVFVSKLFEKEKAIFFVFRVSKLFAQPNNFMRKERSDISVYFMSYQHYVPPYGVIIAFC